MIVKVSNFPCLKNSCEQYQKSIIFQTPILPKLFLLKFLERWIYSFWQFSRAKISTFPNSILILLTFTKFQFFRVYSHLSLLWPLLPSINLRGRLMSHYHQQEIATAPSNYKNLLHWNIKLTSKGEDTNFSTLILSQKRTPSWANDYEKRVKSNYVWLINVFIQDPN